MTVVAAFLMKFEGMGADHALWFIRSRRSVAAPNDAFCRYLYDLEVEMRKDWQFPRIIVFCKDSSDWIAKQFRKLDESYLCGCLVDKYSFESKDGESMVQVTHCMVLREVIEQVCYKGIDHSTSFNNVRAFACVLLYLENVIALVGELGGKMRIYQLAVLDVFRMLLLDKQSRTLFREAIGTGLLGNQINVVHWLLSLPGIRVNEPPVAIALLRCIANLCALDKDVYSDIMQMQEKIFKVLKVVTLNALNIKNMKPTDAKFTMEGIEATAAILEFLGS